jgi:hypothetical protein
MAPRTPTTGSRPAGEIIRGTGSFIGPVASPRVTESGEGDVTLDFVNADVADVAKAVLGDMATGLTNAVNGDPVMNDVFLSTGLGMAAPLLSSEAFFIGLGGSEGLRVSAAYDAAFSTQTGIFGNVLGAGQAQYDKNH